MGRATTDKFILKTLIAISIHALRGEGDLSALLIHETVVISIHALRGEGDGCGHICVALLSLFQSTPSVGRATPPDPPSRAHQEISIHALRGEGDGYYKSEKHKAEISIHALRGEGDRGQFCFSDIKLNISIHALRGEGDSKSGLNVKHGITFQSTPSVGRATCVFVA